MAYDRRSFAGAAVGTTITGSITGSDTTINIASSTGWPSGSAGDFFVVIDRGLATEEKVRIASRTSLALTVDGGVAGRGADGTSATSHSSGATIELCLTAVDLDEANAHLSDTALDHHTQYLNSTRHDVEARHTFGAALGTPATPASIGTANATGSGDNPAREDHVHEIGTGAIDTSAMFAAGVVDSAAIATDAVGTAEIAADAVTATELAADAVTTAKILDDNVTGGKIADEAIAAAHFATSLARRYIVADATALAALTGMREGDEADVTGTERTARYNGTAWRYMGTPGLAVISGTHSDTISSSSVDAGTISFGVTFAAAPVVIGVVQVGSNFDLSLNWQSDPTTTGVGFRVFQNSGSSVNGSYKIHWIAIGELA